MSDVLVLLMPILVIIRYPITWIGMSRGTLIQYQFSYKSDIPCSQNPANYHTNYRFSHLYRYPYNFNFLHRIQIEKKSIMDSKILQDLWLLNVNWSRLPDDPTLKKGLGSDKNWKINECQGTSGYHVSHDQ